jgi:transposase InsO family protein
VLNIFKEFHDKVERETGSKLKCVISDNGGKYRGPFERYCRKFGIRLEKTPPKTPQLNGLAERMNMTLTKRVTAMLSYAMYVLNLSSVPLVGDIPRRVWSSKDVLYKQLKVFGCKTFVHIPRDEISKLDS